MVSWKKIGKQLVSGSGKIADASGKGIKTFNKWSDNMAEAQYNRRKKALRRAEMELKLVRTRAKISKLKKQKSTKNMWDIGI